MLQGVYGKFGQLCFGFDFSEFFGDNVNVIV